MIKSYIDALKALKYNPLISKYFKVARLDGEYGIQSLYTKSIYFDGSKENDIWAIACSLNNVEYIELIHEVVELAINNNLFVDNNFFERFQNEYSSRH